MRDITDEYGVKIKEQKNESVIGTVSHISLQDEFVAITSDDKKILIPKREVREILAQLYV